MNSVRSFPIGVPNVRATADASKQYTPYGAIKAEQLRGKKYRTRDHMLITEKSSIRPDGVTREFLGMAARFEAKYAQKWRGRHIKRPADIERFALWLYGTGSRLREPFLEPYPRIHLSKPRGLPWRILTITRVIEKAFVADGSHARVVHEQNIPIFDHAEDMLWRNVLDDYDTFDLSDLFGRVKELDTNNNLTQIIQHNFRTDMRQEFTGKLARNAPVTPHAFRHHRAYNLYIERGVPGDLVVMLYGWKDDRMLQNYAYINRGAKSQAQLLALQKFARMSSKAD